jgi:hypothetical protein
VTARKDPAILHLLALELAVASVLPGGTSVDALTPQIVITVT